MNELREVFTDDDDDDEDDDVDDEDDDDVVEEEVAFVDLLVAKAPLPLAWCCFELGVCG